MRKKANSSHSWRLLHVCQRWDSEDPLERSHHSDAAVLDLWSAQSPSSKPDQFLVSERKIKCYFLTQNLSQGHSAAVWCWKKIREIEKVPLVSQKEACMKSCWLVAEWHRLNATTIIISNQLRFKTFLITSWCTWFMTQFASLGSLIFINLRFFKCAFITKLKGKMYKKKKINCEGVL